MAGSSRHIVSQVQIMRKIVICDKTQNEETTSILFFSITTCPTDISRKLHNQAIIQVVWPQSTKNS